MTRQDVVASIIGQARDPLARESAGTAPVNIALCKYWGKRDTTINLPVTGSLSVSLGHHGTTTKLSLADSDSVTFNGADIPIESPFAKRLFGFIDLFRKPDVKLHVETSNDLPTAAGLASSASGFAALIRAIDELYDWRASDRDLSILARLGSGSACRSLFDGFAQWHVGHRRDGMDSYADPIPATWMDLRIGIVIVDDGVKRIGSRMAMQLTVETSPLYAAWPATVENHLHTVKAAINKHDLDQLGAAAEQNALAMHATMLAAEPSIVYWEADTVAGIHKVRALRAGGLPVYLTMDAGPNIKLIFEAASEAAVRNAFPDLLVVEPFGLQRYTE